MVYGHTKEDKQLLPMLMRQEILFQIQRLLIEITQGAIIHNLSDILKSNL